MHKVVFMNISDKERIRAQETLAMIPSDVISILNTGCGDGRVTNSLCKKYMITNVDIDKESIKSCLGTKMIANISRLPFEDSKFDLVMATEVLEHLPENIYPQAIKEISRVAKKYILITVPFEEPLAAQWVKCPICGYTFHAWGHLRRFNLKNFDNLFSRAYFQRKRFFSLKEAKLPNWLYIIARKIGNAWNYNHKNSPKCPKCGTLPLKINGNILGWFLIRAIWRLQKVWPLRKPTWIGALFCKKY